MVVQDRIRLTGLLRKRPPRGPFLFGGSPRDAVRVYGPCDVSRREARSRVRSAPQNATSGGPSAHEQLRRPLHAHRRRPLLRDLPARRAAVEVRRRAAAVRAQGPAREPAALRGRAGRDQRRRRGARALGADGRAEPRDRVHAGARADAGLHRGAGRGRPGGDARRDGRAGRRPGPHQPAAAGGARDRPLRAGRRLRHAEGVPDQRRPGVRAQQGALCVPALGPAGVRRLRRRAARHRDRAPGQPRVPRARRVRPRGRRHRAGLPGHARGHRLPHHDGERPRRPGLGSGGDRGRGRDAGPAGLDADARR